MLIKMCNTCPSGHNYLFDFLNGVLSNASIAEYTLSFVERIALILLLLMIALTVFVFMHLILIPLVNAPFEKQWHLTQKQLFKGWALSTFLSGWVVYMIGFCESGTGESLFALLFRSLFSSLEQFVFHSDLIEVAHCCHDSAWFMAFYTFVYGSAICISSIIVINCFYHRLRFHLRRRWWSVSAPKPTHVFFSINDRGLSLARSIYQEKGRGERIVFVNFADAESKPVHNSLSKIFGLSSMDKANAIEIASMHGIIINASSMALDDDISDANSPFILELAGLDKLVRVLKRVLQTSLYFLADDEGWNVKSALNVERSHALAAVKDRKVDIYCKVRRNYENYALVDNATNAHFHLVDDAALAVNTLKMMGLTGKDKSGIPIAHPVNFVKVNSALGIVESSFNCLIVGFGVTGQDALRFFYEFSSFVGSNGEKSLVHIRVVDKKMEQLQGYVRRELPALRTRAVPDTEVRLCDMDYHSADFWSMLEEKEESSGKSFLQQLNCIVVAVGSDEDNITLSTQLYEFAVRNQAVGGKAAHNLMIFVRAYDVNNELRLRTIEAAYRKENDVLRVFGYQGDIYSYHVVIDNWVQQEAQRFYTSYNLATGDVTTWEQRHNKLRTGTATERNEIRHLEKQDRSNALHQYTKLQLLGERRPLPMQYPFITIGDMADIMRGEYSFVSETDKEMLLWHTRLQNVSKCEHLRWNSSHYLCGYLPTEGKKDFRLRLHPCLVDWDTTRIENDKEVSILSDETKHYDYQVVTTTIELASKRD